MNQISKALIMGTQRKLRMRWLALMALAMLLASDVFGVAVSIHGDVYFYKHSTIRFNEVILFESQNDYPNCDRHYVEDWPVSMDLYKTYTISWATTADYGACFSGAISFPDVPSCYAVYINGQANTSYGTGSYPGTPNGSFTVEIRENNTNDISISPNPLTADGISTAQASLTKPYATTVWTILPISPTNTTLGCTISAGGVIRAGREEGTIIVRGTDPISGCYVEGPLDLVTCSHCQSEPCPIGTVQAKNSSVDLTISLGREGFETMAGFLSLKAETPDLALYTPSRLRLNFKRNSVKLITDDYGPRQVKMPEGLADILIQDTNTYEIKFYRATNVVNFSDGLYEMSGSPFQTITIQNPDTGAATNRIHIVSEGALSDYVADYVYTNSGWELTTGSGLRKEITGNSISGSYRTLTRQILNGDSSVAQTSTEHFHTYSWGEALTQVDRGSGGSPLTDSYSYTSDGLLLSTTRADGSWMINLYDAQQRITNVISAFNNSPSIDPGDDTSLCRVIENDYTTNVISGSPDTGILMPGLPRRTVEKVLGQPISLRYRIVLPGEVREIVCVHTNAAWDSTSNLVTITKSYTGGFFKDAVQSVERPDGTMDIHHYAYGGYSYRTNVVMTGQPDTYKTNILDGTKITTVLGSFGQMISRTALDLVNVLSTDTETYSDYDAFNRPQKITYLDGTSTFTVYGCCGESTMTDREGTVITTTYDALQRQIARKAAGITSSNALDAAGNILASYRFGTNGNVIALERAGFDDAGRKLKSTNALNYVTSFGQAISAGGGLTHYTTNADGSTRIETYFRDGSLQSLSGTAVHPMQYEYGVTASGAYVKEFRLGAGASDTNEWTQRFSDTAGRSYKTVYPDAATAVMFYNSFGQSVQQTDPDGVITLTAYNARGEPDTLALRVDRSNTSTTPDYAGTDRITRTFRDVVNTNSADVRRTLTFAWATNSSVVSNLISEVRVSTDGLKTWSTSYGVASTNQIKYAGSGNRYVTNSAADGSLTISSIQHGRLLFITRKDSGGTQIAQTTYGYDVHGRQTSVTDARNGTTTYTYTNDDKLISVTTPPPGTGQSAQITSYTYDNAGRVMQVTLPDGGTVANTYLTTGELQKTSGTRNYPVGYSFDAQGRLKTMTNWSTYPSTGARVTTWNYNTNRGWLDNKRYPDNTGPSYTYTAAGRLNSRVWARSITTTYTTNSAGDITRITYSDGVTLNMTNSFDRLGRATTISQGTNATTLTYNLAGQLMSETCNGLSVTNDYDALLRRRALAFAPESSTLTTYGYDDASRPLGVTNGVNSATYSYLANSPLFSQIAFTNSGARRMTTTKSYDNLNRLLAISSQPAASGAWSVSFAYSYNDANQRVRVTMAGGSYWIYQYDSLGQVTSGKKYWVDGTPVAGQQFEYGFDDIGNRTSTKAGGDSVGSNLRSATYGANILNQYTNRTVPAGLDVLGIANAAAAVTVNAQSTYRRGEYYQAALSFNNTSGPVYLSVTNKATLSPNTNTTTGNLFTPQTAEVFSHDADGNMTNDGRWMISWDAENRPTRFESQTGAPSASKRKVTLDYDYHGRIIRRVEYDGGGGGYVVTNDLKFVYDDWHCLAELNATNNSVVRSYAWGLDLSGSPEGAGGVGGLLMLNSTANGVHFYGYDGNGNVVALIKATDGSVSANYHYDPFGQTIRLTGVMAQENPFRFSTKHKDDAADTTLYENRTYFASTGRWLSRDPIGEWDSWSLYAVVGNDTISRSDPLGLNDYKLGTTDPTLTHDAGAGAWKSEKWTWSNRVLKGLIVDNIGIVWVAMPDAVNHLRHYFGNSGSDYTIRLKNMIDDVPSAKRVYNGELGLAQAFVESLPDGTHSITSGSLSSGYNPRDESRNWYFAVASYKVWGKGDATVCKGEYTLQFQYNFYDRYNWDRGKQVTILNHVVTDEFMGEFHRQGLAKEFDMFGSVKKTVKWKKGQAPKVTDGWDSEKGGR